MSVGKVAAQAFQAAQRLFAAAGKDAELAHLLRQWQEEGTRTCTRIALSQAVFDRACRELSGVLMVDEGMNEVNPDTATCFATAPLVELPQILRHKRMPVLNAEVKHESSRRSSAVEQRDLNPVEHRFESDRLLVPAREAEMDQHRPEDRAEVAGSRPAARLALPGLQARSSFIG